MSSNLRRAVPAAPLLLALVLAAACGGDPAEPFLDHEEASDLVLVDGAGAKADGVASSFTRHRILEDDFYRDGELLSAAALQRFLEATPYGGRSWLADELVDGQRVSDVLVAVAREKRINPVVLLARMQVEQTLVSRTTRPSQSRVNYGLGCGCPDNQECAPQFRGLGRQIACAADTMATLYDASVDGTGEWRLGRARSTLDGYRVTPATHATASLYGYTPWVLEGRGGNWLVWNVTKKYVVALEQAGVLTHTLPLWVGTPCTADSECAFSAAGATGFCYRYAVGGTVHGFCTLPCDGYCPDRSEVAATFCTLVPGQPTGLCVSKAAPENLSCGAIPGTSARLAARYVGTSGAAPAEATVCVP